MSYTQPCTSCQGTGALPSDYGMMDCPDCGGAGYLPPRGVHTEWRARDIERGVELGQTPSANDVRWLLAELRNARSALTSVIALSHDIEDSEDIALRIRFTANRALGIYPERRSGEEGAGHAATSRA